MTRASNGHYMRPSPRHGLIIPGRALSPALDFEDDGASFRVRQERRTHIRQQPPVVRHSQSFRAYFRTMTPGRLLALIFFGLPLCFLAFAATLILIAVVAAR